MLTKIELRRQFREVLKDTDWDLDHSQMKRHISTIASSGTWASYKCLPGELNPQPLTDQMKNVKWVYPRVEGDDLRFFHTQSEEDFTEHPQWGISEPIEERCQPVEINDLDGFLVPGVAFDRQCFRLGRGKGFYDRALSANKKAIKVGVAHSNQIYQETLPVDTHDIQMDYVLTEKELIAAGKEQAWTIR